MPSVVHEIVIQVLREEGVLAELLLCACDLRVGAMSPADPNFSDVKSTEWHGDAFFLKGDPKRPEHWLGLEVQASIDAEKLRTIPLSLELGRDRFRGVPGDVVLVTVGEAVARWFDRHPFVYQGPLGTKRTLTVTRVDLSRVPEAALLDERRPFLALLAVAAHAKGATPRAREIAHKALEVARKGGGTMTPNIVDAILQMTDAQVRQELEAVMLREGFRTDWLQESYLKGKSDGRAEGKVDGKAEGKAEEARGALVRVLTRRGFPPPAHLLVRIEAESDLQRLERWLDIAITAKSISEVFSNDA
jgi:hypothetical protein